MKNKTLIFLTFCSGSSLGANYSLVSVLGLLLLEEHYERYQIG